MRYLLLLLLLFVITLAGIQCQEVDPKDTEVWEPEPHIVNPGSSFQDPPSDATVLLSTNDASAWEQSGGGPVQWQFDGEGALVVQKGTGGIRTKQAFESFQLHLEWRTPSVIEGEGQGRGNSGVFLQERYEVQILDSYENRTYSNGQAASIYKQAVPLANAMRGPGQWQTYDIIYTAPTFKDQHQFATPPYVTVIHNGVLVQNHVEIKGTTEFKGPPKIKKHGASSLVLQDHGNPTAFRNIWIRTL
ncbi:MAG: DUF1080 domain-containing protein [Saprospiraceae bacterium]|nr:DUF1080 domain-containing protein [Saprospiraceae bacterium]